TEGATLSEALRGRGLLPEWVAWMAGAGQQRGTLAPTLRQIAELYRRQVEARAALLRTVMPAFMIIATAGLLVGIFAVTTMLPMIKLLEGLAKQCLPVGTPPETITLFAAIAASVLP